MPPRSYKVLKTPPNTKRKVVQSFSKANKSISRTNSQIEEETKTNSTRRTMFSEKLLAKYDVDDYLQDGKVITKTDDFHCQCNYCKTPPFLAQYLYIHLSTQKHIEKTPSQELETLKKINQKVQNSKEERNDKNKSDKLLETEDLQNQYYLEFIAFALSERLSFSQISRLGKFLKDMQLRSKGNGLNFFKTYNFDQELISMIARESFGPCLLDNLKEKLKKNKYSLSLDSSTISGDNLYALRVRFLDESKDPFSNRPYAIIQNQIIGIHKLEERSDAKTVLDIIRKKVFFDDPEIKSN